MSTICGVIYWEPRDPRSVWNVIFDLRTGRFYHIDHTDELPIHQIPLRRLSDPSEYYRKLSPLDSPPLRETADLLFNRFVQYQVPLVTLGDMSIHDVAPVFERINSTGTRLTIYDLMRAATWSPEFDLGKTIEEIRSTLEPKKFDSLDNKTFLRTLGAAAGGDFSSQSIDALREIRRDKLGIAAEETKKSALLAADFLATEIRAPRAESMPYANQFTVLCELFRLIPNPSSKQLEEVKRWFWLTTLSGYFGGWDSGQMATDTRQIRAFAAGEAYTLGESAVIPSASLWQVKPFRSNSAVSKMLGLMLGHGEPVDLINGQKIDIGKSLAWSNDKEYHHFFPQAYLAKKGVSATKSNVVGNIVLLTSKSNIYIRDKAPSFYLAEVINEVGKQECTRRLGTSLVPEEALDAALNDDFSEFLRLRAEYLHERARILAGQFAQEVGVESPDAIDDSDSDPTD